MTKLVNYRVDTVPKLAGILIIIISGVVLAGEWIFDTSIFQIILPDLPKMVGNTALALMTAGISLLYLRSTPNEWGKYIGYICATITLLIGIVTIGEYIGDWILYTNQQVLETSDLRVVVDRSSPPTALSFIFIGLSLLLLRVQNKRGYTVAQILIILTVSISLLALLGYTYHIASLYQSSSEIGISVPTAILFIVLSVGILFTRTELGIVSIILSNRVDGDIIRRLLPVVFIIPFAVGWLTLNWMQVSQIELNVGLSVVVLLNVIAFVTMIWWTAIEIHQVDQKRRTAETRLDESEKILANILELAADPIITVNDKQEIIQFNIVAQRTFGYTDEEIMGQAFENLLVDEFIQQHQQYILDLASDKHVKSRIGEQKLRARRKNGEEFPIELSISKFLQNGETMFTSILRDTTERVLTENKLRTLNEGLEQRTIELARSNADLQQFAYVASHDLQEPLRTISSFITLLAEDYKGKLGEEADQYIDFIVDGTTRMKILINDLLAYSRIDFGNKSFTLVKSDEALQTALNNLKMSIDESEATIHFDSLPDILFDKGKMSILLQNLIANAIKFRKENTPPEIRISAIERGNFWEFSVSDNGIGIESKFYERIFVIFQRLHSRQEYQGTGIGMAICKRIVESGGGRIWLESELGVGTTFYFTVPIRQE